MLTVPLAGQEATGRILGTVKDATGASISRASVQITNTGTNASRNVESGADGLYQAVALPAGRYTVRASQTGFQPVVTAPQTLEINQSLRVDLTLPVGQLEQTLEVGGAATGVETVNSTLGGTVTNRPLVDLPLNGRNALDLALLQPGVTPTNEGSYFATATGNTNSTGGFSISGGRNDSVTYLLDGGLNNSLLYNDIVYNPNPDAIQEFRILTSNYTAEYGRNAGGIVSMITRSGTDQFHGTLFEFLRNDAFNANSYFSNAQGQPRDILKRNQYGATLGGPVLLPKLFNGRDRLFFFAAYQGQRQTQTLSSGQVSVFTPAEVRGDFSQSPNAASIAQFLLANPRFQPNPTLAAQGIIDTSRIDPVATNYIQAGLIPSSSTGFVYPRGTGSDNREEGTAKIDWLVTERHRVALTLGVGDTAQLSPFDGSNVAGFPSINEMRRYFGNVNVTSVLSPSLLNEARVTAQRQNRLRSAPGATAPLASALGVGITSDNPTGPPILSFSSGLNLGFSGYGPSRTINTTYQFSDTLTWTRGRHTWKTGFYYSPFRNDTVFDFFVNGQFVFAGVNGQAVRTGSDRADFLLGLPDNYYQYSEAPSNIRTASYATFVQDEWRVHPRVVLTLGLRYDYNTPRLDTQGRSFSIVYGRQSQRFPHAPPGLLFPGDPGAPTGANFPDRNDFSPRFGFAWDVTGNARTSVRGGFGVFHDILQGEDLFQYNGVAPFAGSAYLTFATPAAGFTGPSAFAQPYVVAGQPNPFPSRPPSQNLDFYSAFGPFAGYSVDPHLRSPYTYQYNLSLQHQFGDSWLAEAAYVGNTSRKLIALVDPNPFLLGTTTRLLNTQHVAQPDSWGLPSQFINGADGYYNSLQSSLRKRLSDLRGFGGLSFQLSYTLARAVDDASGFMQVNSRVPYYNHRQFRAVSDQDIRHYLALSGTWDLPFDRLASGPSRLLTRGWSLSPILTFRTGQPLDINAGLGVAVDQPGPSGAGDAPLVRPNLTGPVQFFDPRLVQTLGTSTGNFWFNPSAFSLNGLSSDSLAAVSNPSARTYGTLGRNALRGPSRTNLDLRVSKSTYIRGDRVRAELLGEFFNIFNHAQFRNPDLNLNSGTFGIISTTYDPRIVQLGFKLYF